MMPTMTTGLMSYQKNYGMENKMGFFSWITQDTNRSIPSKHSSRKTFSVTMRDDRGNQWTETSYEGYGDFDGKCYYELLSEMNGFGCDRDKGIKLFFSEDKNIKFPTLTEDPDAQVTGKPSDCPNQGFFYGPEWS